MKDSKDNKDFSYIMGRAFGFVVVACLAAIAIASTIRLIMWIL